MIRIISTPVFAIHRKKSYTHIDTRPEDLLNKAKYEKERYRILNVIYFLNHSQKLMLYLHVNMTSENFFLN